MFQIYKIDKFVTDHITSFYLAEHMKVIESSRMGILGQICYAPHKGSTRVVHRVLESVFRSWLAYRLFDLVLCEYEEV